MRRSIDTSHTSAFRHKLVTNIRDDKAQSKFWRTSFEPASSYCEPKGVKPATWHWFSVNGDDPGPVFAFPGAWTRYKGPLKKNGETVEQDVFAFMTTEPNRAELRGRANAYRAIGIGTEGPT